jgi:glutamate-ammonia-ligase adenylyltransferase
MNINNMIKEASADTPDPERALKNFERFLREAPDFLEEHEQQIESIARLFAYSQFLADYSSRNPSSLSRALKEHAMTIDKQKLLSEAYNAYSAFRHEDRTALYKESAMNLLRQVKKDQLLFITLRDISGITSLNECMTELSILSETIMELALDMAFTLMRRKYGLLRENAFSLIGMGKLGAGELNYSSDIDIITIYRSEDSISTGILNPFGIRHNNISSHEYFCSLTEILTNLLMSPTEDGIAYRADLRLRPNGQKGALSLSLDSYISYYEAWGKTWERMALIRARHVAGDNLLGKMFLGAIEPFVWKKSLDYNDIEEIKKLKKKIDSISDVNDIKRGYGGIREIEFFTQAFQLLYGGERKNLRTRTLITSLEELLKEKLLTGEDYKTLSECYLFLRRLEHILQMKDDVQTHSLPSQPDELEILSKKMDFSNEKDFTTELRLRRLKVRDMYNSLLGTAEVTQENILSLKDELPDSAIMDYLSFRGFKDPGTALKNVSALHEKMSLGKTLRERGLLGKTVPLFLQEIIKTKNRDRALSMLVTFIEKIGNHESYIDLLLRRGDTREVIVTTFALSEYLTRSLLSLENLEGLFEYPDIRRDFVLAQARLITTLKHTPDPLKAIRVFKLIEELKSGLLFIKGFLDVYELVRTLSMLADTIVKAVVRHLHVEKNFAVLAMGGYGARELNIGSDLDLIFAGGEDSGNTSPKEKAAEDLIKFLSEYTEEGIAYKVDMRLRPDGSKGVLLNSIEGYRNYYLKSAHLWEIQSLLKARPVAGDRKLLRAFVDIKKMIIFKRGMEIRGSVIKNFRKRILDEISKESPGSYDIRHGPGGIKEIEFLVQYLQLSNTKRFTKLPLSNTVAAIKQLSRYAIIHKDTKEFLLQSHRFLKTVETILRLNGEDLLKVDSELSDMIAGFINLRFKEDLVNRVEETRDRICEITRQYY